MKYLVATLVCFLLIVACKKEPKQNTLHYSFVENKRIDISNARFVVLPDTTTLTRDSIYRYRISNGNKLVFQFDSSFTDDLGFPNQAARTIAFQVSAGATSFVLQDSAALAQAKALLDLSCGECFGGIWFLTNGYIKGEKLNENTWLVDAAVSSSRSPMQVFSFKARFERN